MIITYGLLNLANSMLCLNASNNLYSNGHTVVGAIGYGVAGICFLVGLGMVIGGAFYA